MNQDNRLIAATRKIGISPKMVEQRIVKPVVVTDAVQVKQSSADSYARRLQEILIAQQDIQRDGDSCQEDQVGQEELVARDQSDDRSLTLREINVANE